MTKQTMIAPRSVDDTNSVASRFDSNECTIGRWKWTVHLQTSVPSWPLQLRRLDSRRSSELRNPWVRNSSQTWTKSQNESRCRWVRTESNKVMCRWSERLSLYVGTWVLIAVVSHDQPCSAETGSLDQKWVSAPGSWPEVFQKYKLAWTY